MRRSRDIGSICLEKGMKGVHSISNSVSAGNRLWLAKNKALSRGNHFQTLREYMRLKGTLTEDSYRAELRRTHEYIFHSDQGKILLQALINTFQEMKTAYILYWTPDQGADFYTLIINSQQIVFIEIEEECTKRKLLTTSEKRVVSLRSCSVNDYKKELSKTNRIKLEVALDLIHKDMKDE